MKAFLLSAAAATALVVATLGSGGASAAPAGFGAVAVPDTAVQESRSMGRRRMMRRKMYRSRGMGRMSAPSQAGKARNRSAPVGQQQQGRTTGGPRY